MKRLWPCLLALAACSPKEIKVQVQIVTASCSASADPFAGVQFLRVRVTGDGLTTPLDSVAPTGGSTHEIDIPQIPAGKARMIEVRGFDGDPNAGGKTLSMGRSMVFDVPDVISDAANNTPIAISVFLRKVNTFTPPSSAAAPKDCQQMKVPRAGHSATLLKNGKVFIAGGYNFTQASTAKQSLSDTEVYNPQTNSFESSREMSIANGVQRIPKAFHTATSLKSGQVLLWGGETYTGGVNNTVSPSAIILIYDPDANDYGAVRSRTTPPAIARTQHQAVVDTNGKVLIVGGLTRAASLSPADKVEWFDPATNDYLVVSSVTLPRQDAVAAPIKGGSFIAVAGGTDGTAFTNDVVFFKWDGMAFTQQTLATPPRLAVPGRRAAGVATLRDGADLILVGGYSDVSQPTPIASSEIVNTDNSTVSPGPTIGARGSVCAVQLADGSVMAIGGTTIDAVGTPQHSDSATVIIRSSTMGGAQGLGGPPLSVPRYQHTCTALPDGTVLVLGGVNEQNGTKEILQDAWIFQPAPVD